MAAAWERLQALQNPSADTLREAYEDLRKKELKKAQLELQKAQLAAQLEVQKAQLEVQKAKLEAREAQLEVQKVHEEALLNGTAHNRRHNFTFNHSDGDYTLRLLVKDPKVTNSKLQVAAVFEGPWSLSIVYCAVYFLWSGKFVHPPILEETSLTSLAKAVADEGSNPHAAEDV